MRAAMTHRRGREDVDEKHEPMLNLPGVVTALLALLAIIQLFVSYGPVGLAEFLYDSFAFVPIRLAYRIAPQSVLDAASAGELTMERLAIAVGGGRGVFLTPITYALLHGGWTHLAINGLTLSAFGAPVARRFGDMRFLLFLAGCAIAGALAHYVLHRFDATPVVGASAAISGTMAAVVRFAFNPGERLGENGAMRGRGPKAASLAELGGNRQAMFFLVVWFGVNFLLGVFPEVGGASETVAWEAHMGGFLFGLLTFGAFDRFERRA
jgi:membrane associated rhomboid family serine protease